MSDAENDEQPWLEDWVVDWGEESAWCDGKHQKDYERRDSVAGIGVKGGWSHDGVVRTDSGVYPPSRARAKLIAQAPVMARLLLAFRTENPKRFQPAVDDALRAAGVLL